MLFEINVVQKNKKTKTYFLPSWDFGKVGLAANLSLRSVSHKKKTISGFLPRECEVRLKRGRVGGERERAILLY